MDGRHFFLFAAMSDPLFFPIFSFGYNLGVGLSVGSDPNFFVRIAYVFVCRL